MNGEPKPIHRYRAVGESDDRRFWGTTMRNEVIEKLRFEAVRRGITITQLVNQTLDEAIPNCRIVVDE